MPAWVTGHSSPFCLLVLIRLYFSLLQIDVLALSLTLDSLLADLVFSCFLISC